MTENAIMAQGITENEVASVRRLKMSYAPLRAAYALDGVDLDICRGELIALTGDNGSGKTTLLKILAGLIRSFGGSVRVMGTQEIWRVKDNICYQSAEPYFQPEQTVKSAIETNRFLRRKYDAQLAYRLCEQFGIELSMRMRQLSKGRRALTMLILSLCCDAQLYLLDEPFGGIDIKTREQMKQLILGRLSEENTFVIATHELSDMQLLFDRLVVLKQGKVMLDRSADELRAEHGCSLTDLVKEVL